MTDPLANMAPHNNPPDPAPGADVSAFWQAADRLRPYLRVVAARTLGNQLTRKVDASDIVQEGLAAAVDRFGQFRGRDMAEWQGWLAAIVRNEALNQRRYWDQELRDAGREQNLAIGSTGGIQLAGENTSPGSRVDRRERAVRLLAVIEQLPADYRQVLELRNFEGLPYADIAERMDRNEAAVRQLWVRALRQLRKQLGDLA